MSTSENKRARVSLGLVFKARRLFVSLKSRLDSNKEEKCLVGVAGHHLLVCVCVCVCVCVRERERERAPARRGAASASAAA